MKTSNGSFGSTTVVLSVLLGAAAGAAAVLLLAPKARRESATRIREFSHDLKGRATATIDAAKETVSGVVARGREFLDEERSVISSAVEAGKEAYARSKAHATNDH
jgi:gas vesicle protein